MTIILSFCCPVCGGDSGSRDEPQECRDCIAKRLACIVAGDGHDAGPVKCAYYAKGFCAASVDGYCVDGWGDDPDDRNCHG
jgi:hypothetical protein